MTHGRYLVTGSRKYRGHDPGTIFEANIDPAVEQRAIQRGAIRLLERVRPGLEPGSYTLPHQTATEAPQGASLMQGRR